MNKDTFASLSWDDIGELSEYKSDIQEYGFVPKKLDYIFEPDVITLSFSKLEVFRRCPREFFHKELYRKGGYKPSLDTSYGHAFAAGVQKLFETEGNIYQAFLAAVEAWDYRYLEDPYNKTRPKPKSFWHCIYALMLWANEEFPILNAKYKLFPTGIELFAYLRVNDSHSYQVHIDLVLQNRYNGNLTVTEIKTSGSIQSRAMWENSLQTRGYYTVIKAWAKQQNLEVEPEILYIVQQTGKLKKPEENYGFFKFFFEPTSDVPDDFMLDLAMQCATINLYIQNNYFPKDGKQCVRYGRECELFGICDESPDNLPDDSAYISMETKPDISLTFEEIVRILEN